MTDWTQLLVDPRAVRAIFGETCPSLDGVELHEVVLDRDGPTVSLRFDLRDFPTDPPTKWREAGFNRVQVSLQAIGVRELDIRGLLTEPTLDLSTFRDCELVHVRGTTDGMLIDLAADFLAVTSDSVSAYLDLAGP
jgi:Immunity protein 50